MLYCCKGEGGSKDGEIWMLEAFFLFFDLLCVMSGGLFSHKTFVGVD